MKKMFFDAEFTQLQKRTTLISIGLISDCGKTFYAEFTDFDESQTNCWINQNVISKLSYNRRRHIVNNLDNFRLCGNSSKIRKYLIIWLEQFNSKLEFWSDCLSYDWVLFIDLLSNGKTAFDIPEFIYYIPFDICTSFKELGINPDINRENFVFNDQIDKIKNKHNALHDAQIIKMCYDKIQEIKFS